MIKWVTSCNLKCIKNNKAISKPVCLENKTELTSLSEIIMLSILWGSKFLSLLSLLSKIFLHNLSVRACLWSDKVTRLALTSASSCIKHGK